MTPPPLRCADRQPACHPVDRTNISITSLSIHSIDASSPSAVNTNATSGGSEQPMGGRVDRRTTGGGGGGGKGLVGGGAGGARLMFVHCL